MEDIKDESPFDLLTFKEETKYKKDDPPLVDLKVTNPVTYLKKWFKRVLGNEGITFHFRIKPLTAILMSVAIVALTTGTTLSLPRFLPSYFVADQVVMAGNLVKKGDGFILITPNLNGYNLSPKKGIDLNMYKDNLVIVKGNLNKKVSELEVTEIFLR